MARNLSSKHKLCRRVGEKLCASDKCPATRRPYPPGAHGPTQTRAKLSSFGLQLREKQKAKFIYGLHETQFRKYINNALKKKGNTTELLLQTLERRLDNVIFRLGFSKTRNEARQRLNHGHFLVNGKKVTIPSYEVRVGDIVAIRSQSSAKGSFKGLREQTEKYEAPSWLLVDKVELTGKVLELPKAVDLQTIFNPKLIVEFYSR